MIDPFDDPQIREFLERADRELLPMIRESAITTSLWSGHPDPKQAIEFGYMVLLDKPIVIVVIHGAKVPDKVVRVADAIIEWTDDRDVMIQRIQETARELLGDDD